MDLFTLVPKEFLHAMSDVPTCHSVKIYNTLPAHSIMAKKGNAGYPKIGLHTNLFSSYEPGSIGLVP